MAPTIAAARARPPEAQRYFIRITLTRLFFRRFHSSHIQTMTYLSSRGYALEISRRTPQHTQERLDALRRLGLWADPPQTPSHR
jgi:hypothetical protein